MKLSHIKTVAREVERIISEYITDEMSEKNFFNEYPSALDQFEDRSEDEAYHPLHLLVPTDANSERAWKENMIEMYKQHMKELEEQLDCDEESYAEKLSTSERKSLCKEALKQIRNQVNDISAKCWIEENLVDDVVFDFTTVDGFSKFGESKLLYSTPIFSESFLLTALSQVLVKPRNTFQQILSSLREVSADEHCFWSRCSEIDGSVADVKIVFSYAGNAFDQLNQLAWIERTDPQETQWGDCHLLLMPFSYNWMLKISNNFNDLKIELHADKSFLKEFSESLDRCSKNGA